MQLGGRSPKVRKVEQLQTRPTVVVSQEKRSLGLGKGSVKVAQGDTVEEKGSIFLAVVAYPVQNKSDGERALTILRQAELC